ncbi:MAG: discoidin domain-containing protein [Oscillospiraceae bacterium]|nr:discoidin domain-containing protein [Oscillospiraceae bacterium]
MNTFRKILVVLLAIIALFSLAGMVFLIVTPEPERGIATALTVIPAPVQTKAEVPAAFVLPEMETLVLPEGENLAKGKKVTFSDYTDVYPGKQAVDGRERTYWEGAAFPSWITVDLAEPAAISKIVLRVPPQRNWGKRTQVISLAVSLDGESFTDIVTAASYVFDPQTGNGVLVEFEPVEAQYVRATIESNTGATGGQLSELCVYSAE